MWGGGGCRLFHASNRSDALKPIFFSNEHNTSDRLDSAKAWMGGRLRTLVVTIFRSGSKIYNLRSVQGLIFLTQRPKTNWHLISIPRDRITLDYQQV